jgi:hypothetical protein
MHPFLRRLVIRDSAAYWIFLQLVLKFVKGWVGNPSDWDSGGVQGEELDFLA